MDQEVLDENELILGMMRRDGVDLTCPYRVEHHFSGRNFELLEKLAIALYSLGFEVTDPDEFTDERGRTAFAFDAFREMISRTTLALSLERGEAQEAAAEREWDINGRKAVLRIRKNG